MKVLSLEITHRVVLLAMAALVPTMASAQVPLNSETRPSLTQPAVEAAVVANEAGVQSPDVPHAAARHYFPDGREIGSALGRHVLPIVQPGRTGTKFQGSTRSQAATKPRGKAVGWGIAIGVGAGIAVSGLAASKYGENEGGQFCGRCFVQWSAITVPVGASVGAAVGYLIDRSRR